MTVGAFEFAGRRERLRESLSNSCTGGYKSVDLGYEKFPLPSRWPTGDPVGDFGVPEELAYLECGIYEKLPLPLARQWPERFVNAIPARADLGDVADRLMLWLLRDEASPLMLDIDVAQRLWRDKFPLGKVADLFDRRVAGDSPDASEVEALCLQIEDGVREEILRRESAVIYACSALVDMVRYAADRAESHLPAAAVRCVASASQQLETYSPEARRAIRASRQYVGGLGYSNRAVVNAYGAVADALVGYIMEAPRIGG